MTTTELDEPASVPERSYVKSELTLKQALRSMGYKEKNKTWLKPVGFNCFVFHEGRSLWLNYMLSLQNKLAIWSTMQAPVGADAEGFDWLHWLKTTEAFANLTGTCTHSAFELHDELSGLLDEIL